MWQSPCRTTRDCTLSLVIAPLLIVRPPADKLGGTTSPRDFEADDLLAWADNIDEMAQMSEYY